MGRRRYNTNDALSPSVGWVQTERSNADNRCVLVDLCIENIALNINYKVNIKFYINAREGIIGSSRLLSCMTTNVNVNIKFLIYK